MLATNLRGTYLGCRVIGAQMRDRFIPRIKEAPPDSLLDASGENFDPAKVLACMMQREKSGGHTERSIAIGTIEVSRRICTTRSWVRSRVEPPAP